MAKTAYDRAMELRLEQRQAEQRSTPPLKVGQQLLRDWLGAHGLGAVIDPLLGADLVHRVKLAIEAERAAVSTV